MILLTSATANNHLRASGAVTELSGNYQDDVNSSPSPPQAEVAKMFILTAQEAGINHMTDLEPQPFSFLGRHFVLGKSFAPSDHSSVVQSCREYLDLGVVCLVVELGDRLSLWFERQVSPSNIAVKPNPVEMAVTSTLQPSLKHRGVVVQLPSNFQHDATPVATPSMKYRGVHFRSTEAKISTVQPSAPILESRRQYRGAAY
ncbi:hypothetical protein [Neosynechococcus sphagnicola]|uniref:hypothetical protein n=1 Tax=Neosynechococcus sphagnicola TaxID=1501145 RepID=UPI0012E06CBD|nr:hypothetical protein [Neosynechococcus sphagnicola]